MERGGRGAVVPTDPLPSSGFVGRERELAELGAALANALDGRGGLILITGEPGIGKTRLLEETAAVAQSNGARVVTGRCWEGGGAPAYWPWIQILRQLRGEVDASLLKTLTADGDVGGAGEEALRFAGSVSPDGDRFCWFDSVALSFSRAAGRMPMLILLDDLHWSDASSLMLLRFLSESLARSRILVIGSYREFEARSSPVLEILSDLVRVSMKIPLRGLAADEVADYIEMASGTVVRDQAVRAVHRATEGNPLFLREVVRLLIAEDRLAVADEVPGDPRLRIPDEVRALMRRRIGALPDDTMRALEVAAVLGREFSLAALQRTAALEPDRLLEALDHAIGLGLLATEDGAPGRYRFSHALVRETIYDDLSAPARLALHGRIADALTELYGADADQHLAELSHHHYEALPLGDAARALDLARRAGERAMATFAYEEAALRFARALQTLEQLETSDDRARCELLLRLGEAQWRSARKERARETFTDASRLARALGDGELLALAALGYAGSEIQGFTTRTEETLISLLEEALEALDPGDSLLRVRLLARLAVDLYWMGMERRLELSDEAVAMARRLGDPRAQLVALYSKEWAVLGPDTLKERLAAADEILELARRIGDREMTYLGHQFRVTTLMELDDTGAVDAEIAICDSIAAELGMPLYRWQTQVFHAMRALAGGALLEGERSAEHALRIGQQGPTAETVTTAYGAQDFYRRWLQGTLAELYPAMKSFAEAYPWMAAWSAGLTFAAAELGLTAEARADLERLAADRFGGLPRDAGWLTAMWALASCSCTLGHTEHAATIYELLLPYADRTIASGYVLSFGSVATPLAMLSSVLGRYAEADAHFDEAMRRNAKMGHKPMLALTARERAAMILARDGAAGAQAARALLEECIALIDSCGLEGLRPRALALLERTAAEPAETEPAPVEHAHAVFHREGDYWTIAWEGTVFRLRDSRGLHHLAFLLARPGEEVHAVEVAAADAAAPDPDRAARATADHDAGLHASRLEETDELLDAEAKAAFKQRLTDLEEDLEEARSWGDDARAERARTEIEALAAELARATGLGGRTRALPSSAERARVSVTKAIRAAIERIAEHAPALAHHLQATVRTGRLCAYGPDDGAPAWRL